jgi:HPt (histidine-containing phosphotransfer) domain-containing protein
LDWAELSRRCDHDHREITALIACFLESSRATLREMTQELRYQNWSGIKQHAHALRGSCLIMTASALAHLCARIEEARFPEIQLLSQRLLSSWRVLEQALIRYLGNAG